MERDKSSLIDKLKTIGILATTVYIAKEVSQFALTREARGVAGDRDKWHCQGVDGEDCYMETLTGERVSFPNGYYVTLAHYKTTMDQSGKGYHDPLPENARCLCQVCHSTEEVDVGNVGGANLLLDKGIYTKSDVMGGLRDQVYIGVEDALEMRQQARDIKREELRESIIHLDKERLESIRTALGGGKRRRV